MLAIAIGCCGCEILTNSTTELSGRFVFVGIGSLIKIYTLQSALSQNCAERKKRAPLRSKYDGPILQYYKPSMHTTRSLVDLY